MTYYDGRMFLNSKLTDLVQFLLAVSLVLHDGYLLIFKSLMNTFKE